MYIVGLGSYVPGEPITNAMLATVFGDVVHKVGDHFGVTSRHFTLDYQTDRVMHGGNSDFCVRAIHAALAQCPHVSLDDVDLIISASSTPDDNLPTLSSVIQSKLGIQKTMVMDIRGGCAAIIQAILTAKVYMASGLFRTVIVTGSDCCSRVFYPYLHRNKDRARVKDVMNTLLFGDGAGAVIMQSTPPTSGGFQVEFAESSSEFADKDPGFIFSLGGSNTSYLGQSDVALSRVFQHFPKNIERYLQQVIRLTQDRIQALGVTFADFSHVIGPQANQRLVQDMNERLMGYRATYYYVGDRVGNVPGGALLMALDSLSKTYEWAVGDNVLLMGMESPKWLYGYAILRRVSL